MQGYFRITRGIFSHPVFSRSGPFTPLEAWIWLIEKANYEEGQFKHGNQMFVIPRGSYGTRYRFLAEKWRWSTDRVIRALNLWQSQGMVKLETRHGYIHITVCNYEIHQNPHDTDATATRQQHDTDATPTSTNQIKVSKEIKEKNIHADLFPLFWSAYPTLNRSKGSKKKANEKYLTALKKADHETIMQGVQSYAAYLNATGQSNADAFRWLEQERWNDDYSYASGSGQQPRDRPSKYDQLVEVFREAAAEREQGGHSGA